jgi:hypothetical protein
MEDISAPENQPSFIVVTKNYALAIFTPDVDHLRHDRYK